MLLASLRRWDLVNPFLLNNLAPLRQEEGVEDLFKQLSLYRGTGAQLNPGIAFLGPGVNCQMAFGEDDGPRNTELINMAGDGEGGYVQGVAYRLQAHVNDTVVQEVSDVGGVAQKVDLMGPEICSQ